MAHRALALTLLALSAPASADWLAGAARVDITPPVFYTASDAAAFPSCPLAVFSGLRPFSFEEPYIDVNANGVFDYGIDVFCDANLNGRWDGIFISGGVNHQAQAVHDPLDVRAIAISDGAKSIVIESVVAQGLFINVIDRVRDRARQLRPTISDVIVSANHNESSPDTIGIYGAPSVMDAFGARSGIDDYYIDFLVEQAAQAAAGAVDNLQPATLWAHQFRVPSDLRVALSNNFPTTDDDNQPAAIDPKIGVLQARDTQGVPLFTLMNLAAHNQEIGHSGVLTSDLSSDWPGYFHAALEARMPGMAMYLVGDNGSEEDPQTVPPLADDAATGCPDGCYAQAQATGTAFAAAVAAEIENADAVAPGEIVFDRADFFVPIENNLFKAAARAGIFGNRPTYIASIEIPAGQGTDLKTTVSVLDLGPDFQLLANPGEAFPALMLGSPWGIEDAGCPDRANPPVPTWHARARFRFQAGLANDMIGYMIPAWAFSSGPGSYLTTCNNDSNNRDPAGHKHKLEDEGLGPVASNSVANQLASLLDHRPDPLAEIRRGRYLRADGSSSRKADNAVAIWIADANATALAPGQGTLVALASVANFGAQAPAAHGVFMDYDGEEQAQPDITTRGMLVKDVSGAPVKRWYLDLYPALSVAALPPAQMTSTPPAQSASTPDSGGSMNILSLSILLGGIALRRIFGRHAREGGHPGGAQRRAVCESRQNWIDSRHPWRGSASALRASPTRSRRVGPAFAGMTTVLSICLAACGTSTLPVDSRVSPASDPASSPGVSQVKAGVGVVDDTWQVGACAGQYCDTNADAQSLLHQGEVDPFFYHRAKDKSYGVQSRLSARAIVVEGNNGKRIALLKTDNYLAQDMLVRRVAQLLDADGTSGIHYDDILYHVSHDHTAAYYATLSWGVWLFEDVYDQRAFEFQARKMAQAIETAAANLKPARLGATVVRHTIYKGNVVRLATADDGTPAGYPLEYNDHQLTVLRFDDVSDAANPKPLAVWINWGEHPESLNGYDLHSADYLAALQRFVEHDVGAPLVFSQGDVGSSENTGNAAQVLDDAGNVCGQWPDPAPAPAQNNCPAGQGVLRDWDHRGFVQTERNVRYLADSVVKAFKQIGDGDPSVIIPFTGDFPVDRLNAWVPGPVSHPYPSVSNCRTDPTLAGDPGFPILGLPDCARASGQLGDAYPTIFEPLLPVFAGLGQVAGVLQDAGIPIPDHYDFTGFSAVEENIRLRLQTFRLGDILLASCACEAQNDLILNLKSRLDTTAHNIYDGFDWACLTPEHAAEAVCQQQKQYYDIAEFPTPIPGSTTDAALIEHLRAQVHNDARGWDDPANALAASSEPTDLKKIWGNFTKEEIQDLGVTGYKLPVGIGHAADYNGYTVSYREYMNRDSYRKALTSYGPHTADYMVTRLVRMAASMKGGPPLAAEFLAPIATVDETRQQTLATALGQITSPAYDAWLAAIPQDAGPARVLAQPQDIEHFNAATFSWVGGSTAIDNPIARVEREVASEQWQTFADMSGEVQTKTEFPRGLGGVVDTYAGNQEWHWTANFEAYASSPARLGSTPAGRYRFVVDGVILQGGDQAYHFVSDPFNVSPWGGVTVTDAALDGAGDVSFRFPPPQYPRSYTSVFRYIKDDNNSRICETCTFRPWASSGAPASVVVTVQRAGGIVEKIAATQSGEVWKAATALAAGDSALIAAGDLRDSNGETNRAAIPLSQN